MMKFDHIVNYNGTYYRAGEEVPIEETKTDTAPVMPEVESEPKAEAPKRRGRRSRKEV